MEIFKYYEISTVISVPKIKKSIFCRYWDNTDVSSLFSMSPLYPQKSQIASLYFCALYILSQCPKRRFLFATLCESRRPSPSLILIHCLNMRQTVMLYIFVNFLDACRLTIPGPSDNRVLPMAQPQPRQSRPVLPGLQFVTRFLPDVQSNQEPCLCRCRNGQGSHATRKQVLMIRQGSYKVHSPS